MRSRSLVLTTALLWPVSVFSKTPDQFVNGNDLFRDCSDQHDSAQGYCQGYVAGMLDAFMAVNALKATGLAIPSACPPKEDLTPNQVRDIVLQWLTAHPATRHNAATHEALAALLAAFPCKEQAH